MTLLTWLALSAYLLAFLVVATFAMIYVNRARFMPYHSQAVARPWSELDPRVQLLMLAFMRIVGWAWLAATCAGLMFLYLVFFEFPGLLQLLGFQGFCLLMIAPVIVVSGHVQRQTGAKTPWLAGVLVALLTVAGFVVALLTGHHSL
ncbi:MAG: hypothetical protein RSE94_23465 [Pseudomonas sp.]